MNHTDWTRGGDRLVFQRCAACHHAFYFHRGFCPACGDGPPVTLPSSGRGTVHARTLVQRAPSDEFRAIVPYCIVLVDMAEGFRVMGHAEPTLAIGDPVTCRIEIIAGRPMPFFSADTTKEHHAS
jgi:uncharacterized OB-fold protein